MGRASWGGGDRARRVLAGTREYLTTSELAARAGVSRETARQVMAAQRAAGVLEPGPAVTGASHRPATGWRVKASAQPHLLLGTAEVSVSDLDILLAHFYDEVLGHPARSHWRLPLLRAAADRLADATRPPGADVHPALRREITP